MHKVAAGDHMLSPSVTAQLIARLGDDEPESERVARRAVAGRDPHRSANARWRSRSARARSNAQIAEELYMSVATVKAHVSRIMVKLEAANRVQIAIRVHDAGLL